MSATVSGKWRSRALLLAPLVLGASACSEVLEVSNPNNVVQEDVERPGAAASLVNGALAQTAHAASVLVWLQSGLLSDEFTWIGSQTQIQAINQGQHDVLDNQWTTQGFEQLAIARWLSDEAIRLLSQFDADGLLGTPAQQILIGRAHMYSGFNYMTIPDIFEDFAFSDRTEAGPPVGEANMHTVYDTAIERLDRAVQLFQQNGEDELELTARAMRARAHWAKAMWQKMAPGTVPAQPLIDDAAANSDAEAVLQRVPANWRFAFTFSGNSQPNQAAEDVEDQGNVGLNRKYFRLGPDGRVACGPWSPTCPDAFVEIADPIDGVESPALRDFLFEFVGSGQFAPLVAVSAQELNLMLAEAALARGEIDEFAAHINAVRAVYPQLTPYDPAVHTSIEPRDLLKHERTSNLFLFIARRMADHYRFDEPSEFWISNSRAATQPGALFPVPQAEREANCYYLGTCG